MPTLFRISSQGLGLLSDRRITQQTWSEGAGARTSSALRAMTKMGWFFLLWPIFLGKKHDRTVYFVEANRAGWEDGPARK
jgi:hypothetical protein